MLLEARLVHLDSIDYSDRWNLHPWERYSISDDLFSSLASAGIIHPPILMENDQNSFEIICGFKRFLFAASILNVTETVCLILEKHTEPSKILEIVLTDQNLARPISLAEKARFLDICSRHLQPQAVLDTFFDRLMLEKRPSTLASLSAILTQHPLLLSEIHRGTLQDKILAELLKLASEEDRLTVVKLFQKLRMGDGKQRKILPLLRDLAVRQNQSIKALVESPGIETILEHPDMNNPQKIQHLSAYLQHQINPLSIQAEKEFASRVNLLKMPKNCTITHSPSFEKDEVTLSITFEDFSACKEWIPTLKRNLGVAPE